MHDAHYWQRLCQAWADAVESGNAWAELRARAILWAALRRDEHARA